MPLTQSLQPSNSIKLLLVGVVIGLIALIPRAYQLDRLGFYSDEEITSTAAKYALLEGNPRQEGGMPYSRALIHTYFNTFFAAKYGVEKEASYRWFSVITGVAFVTLFALLVQPFVGFWPAVLGALLLTFSDWHITLSREARMYGPLMLAFTVSVISLWQWAISAKPSWLLLGIICAAISINLHVMGGMLALFCLLPALVHVKTKTPLQRMLAASFFLAGGTILHEKVVKATFREWRLSIDQSAPEVLTEKTTMLKLPEILSNSSWETYSLAVFAVVATIALFIYKRPAHNNYFKAFAWYCTITLTLLSAAYGQIYATALFLSCAVLQSDNMQQLLSPKSPILLTVIILSLLGILILWTNNISLTKAFSTPFPYLIYIAIQYPVLVLLFLWGSLQAVRENAPLLKLFVLGTLTTLIAIGLAIASRHDIRYVVACYPFLIAISAVGLFDICKRLMEDKWKKLIPLTAVSACLLGVVGGHNVYAAFNAATLDYGDTIPGKLWPYPDHKTTGNYVRDNMKAEDIIVAEDVLQQAWYIGKVDYWLRSEKSTKKSFYRDQNGNLRNTYTHALGLTDSQLLKLGNTTRRVWLITSAETRRHWEYNLSPLQLELLKSIRKNQEPAYIGKDNFTEVYLFSPKEHMDFILKSIKVDS